jgi:ABC-2 type transport system permease protein
MNAMNPESNAGAEFRGDAQGIAPAAMTATQPMCWSIRRELWENHSIYIGPLTVAGVYLISYTISLIWLPHNMREVWMPHTMREMAMLKAPDSLIGLAMPYAHAGMLIMLVAFMVGMVYSLEALHGERSDRSILFWKSLPVSNLTTVLSKASIPLVVLPLLVVAITLALHQTMRLLSLAVLLASGGDAGALWSRLPMGEMELGLIYGVIVVTLWHAPLYAWVLLVSGWARRATFLWSVLPPVAIAVFETIAFHTSHVGHMLQHRVFGFGDDAFNLKMPDGSAVDTHFIPVSQFTPGRFFSSPGLWVGLIVAAALLAAAVRMRRYKGPI